MVSITFQPTTEDRILFVGGGEVAERRMQLFIEEPCQIVVIAPTVTDTISQWAKENRITWCDRAFTMDDEEHIISSSLLFICTDNHELNATLYELGKKHRVWTNRSDDPSACSFTAGDPITAEIVEHAVYAIRAMDPPVSTPRAPARGDLMRASIFLDLMDSLNSI